MSPRHERACALPYRAQLRERVECSLTAIYRVLFRSTESKDALRLFNQSPIPRRRAKLYVLAAIAVLAIVLAGCSSSDDATPTAVQAIATVGSGSADETPEAAPTLTSTSEPTATAEVDATQTPEVGPDGLFTEVQYSEDGKPYLIPADRIFSGGVPRDGIPSIDSPQFASSDTWDEYEYRPDGLVIGVEVDGVRRAYPFQVIVWHELVNDTINGEPILISYCPLCGSAIAFERRVEGRAVEFGVSGLLYNSDLLMYDRESETLWSQINGAAVSGDRVGDRLSYYPSEVMTWGDWRETYPDSEVLTTETGATRDYSRDPYGDYYFEPNLMFPTNQTSDIFKIVHTKTDITGVEVDGPAYGAFVSRDVQAQGVVNETVGATPVVVFANPQAGENIVVFERSIDDQILTVLYQRGWSGRRGDRHLLVFRWRGT